MKIIEIEEHEVPRVVVSTWQSIFREPPEFFSDYSAVIVDEAHTADANSLKGIIEKMPHVQFRTGFTGTLDGSKSHELFMRGIFGKVIRPTTSRKLMDQGRMAELNIEVLRLKYPTADCKVVCKLKYHDEIQYLIKNDLRNALLVDLFITKPNNILALFNFVEGHGKKLFEAAQKHPLAATKQFFLLDASTPVEERERVRALIETCDNVVIFASYGLFSTGINMKNLHYVIFCHPLKSRIRNLQSIGRGLRIMEGKSFATLVDICDDLTHGKKQNITFLHSIERLKIYESEQFKYTVTDVTL